LDENFTPKQVATALQVSESSVKRWCDRGVIRTDRTLGGHRRIPLPFLLEFLETTDRRLANPSAIGLTQPLLPSREAVPVVDPSQALNRQFEQALTIGDEHTCRKIVSAWYSTHNGIASVADDLIAPAFKVIGEKWACGELDVYQERRGCEISNRLIHELRRLLPEPQGFSPLAMGGTASGDLYQLPTQIIEMVFREYGWRTAGLGANIPFASLLSAARKHMPKIFWLSVSHIQDPESFKTEYDHFSRNLPKGVMLVVGGQALTEDVRKHMSFAAYCDNLGQLSNLARAVRASARPIGGQI
jgi:MerR family transcriptional regulator, light-induced transcriptional regulator